ncbi:hypothetical protein [Bacteroides pyogenes]|uniref:Uncharacterized protein n=1 Tax=Bacteroides pyogenes TaxID=310300 RepID=A0A5D3EHJ2_9BACE|nr:hypothetical protein [Bacteroides pyogenes]MBR8725811.1 hypothetical protein [Bacteroides pyogenes]MBR8739481.1 hypothetical protein [Bacteroides pyogenes]MBR8754970.1 hypothetical protein [Bacteroides pyogenes]MBR8796311.1 hypothetical protein [Bacteroides pyogenes]MBR8809809.1 hypothetical protein [Bacteroides pyogenes]
MSKSGLIPLWTDSDVNSFYSYFTDRAEDKIFQMLSAAGERYIEVARKSGSYKDHTGNLRSSVGYMIFRDGKRVADNFEKSQNGTDRQTGVTKARRLAKKIALEVGTGWVLILTAGMEYAARVEALGYDVATSGTIQSEEYLRETSKNLFDKLAKRGY